MKKLILFVLLSTLFGCQEDNSKNHPASTKKKKSNAFKSKFDKDSCRIYLYSLMDAMENTNLDSALQMNRAYSLFCKEDSLTWLTGQLDIARRIFQDHDSSIHYLKLIYNREDFKEEWEEQQLLIGLALHFDAKGVRDSACTYVQKLKNIGQFASLKEEYRTRITYCDQ